MKSKKTENVNVLFTPEKKEQTVEIAGRYDMTLSEFVRAAVDYVSANLPKLGKSVAPKEQGLQTNNG